MSGARRSLLVLALLAGYAAAPGSRALPAQACEWEWTKDDAASLGIGRLLCVGGDCEINLVEPDGRLAHRFTTEPRVMELREPAASRLREGDVIVAVDGAPITTPEGGRRLARVTVGTSVDLTIRRGEALRSVRLVPIPGCPIGSLSVRRPGAAGEE